MAPDRPAMLTLDLVESADPPVELDLPVTPDPNYYVELAA